jgi:hypothetical protein
MEIRTGDLGTLLLAVWLILTGLMVFIRMSFPGRDRLLGALALLAGIFILVGR